MGRPKRNRKQKVFGWIPPRKSRAEETGQGGRRIPHPDCGRCDLYHGPDAYGSTGAGPIYHRTAAMRRKVIIACLCLALLLGIGLFWRNTDSDIWIVRYQTHHHAETLGFGLTEWEDGYFVAHDYTCSGRRIKERPERVRVDGVWYQYVSERIVSRDTTWDEVESFVHQKGGIGFQTCYKDRYLVTHYEPAE